jgi:hypothetical protein
LADYEIEKAATLHLLLRLCGGAGKRTFDQSNGKAALSNFETFGAQNMFQ